MRTYLALTLLVLPLTACGGGDTSFGSGAPRLILSAAMLDFGTEIVGDTSSSISVTVTNSGTAALRITALTASTNFGETDDCGSMVASGANCSIDVTFNPAAAGTLSGMITLTDNAAGSPHVILLSGTGSFTGPRCSGKGQECPPQFPPCCPGLTCTAASTRAFCE